MQNSHVEFKSETLLKKLLIGGTAIAAFNSFERGDYNIAIYPLIYLIFERPDQIKNFHVQAIRLAYLLLFTLVIDVFWFIYWSNEFSTILDNSHMQWMSTPVHITIILSVIGIFIKLGVAYFMQQEHSHIHENVGIEHNSTFATDFLTNHHTPQASQQPQNYQSSYQQQDLYNQQDQYNGNDYKVSSKKQYKSSYQNYE